MSRAKFSINCEIILKCRKEISYFFIAELNNGYEHFIQIHVVSLIKREKENK